ncbi:Stp1/IreP family PP2C-type Ser/Thr phosphatase [Paramaledivibacter caminithermalis]|jgi:protein phosphatase|uniref:Protein phosphatase n=1 Tax=Paramaledivibacter caminithermalis (strain DSM 15212 / CIP 107654 / DViRD3) TaxID=1121301 RepID=A0A1M6NHL2_PARC5|nr:Stp1/IreP family PP2C-type Ser/Thr phosphatase [Paramaledivibacter caminithermalis]SHJ95190.1 protein phosphatase [Paramaledivibacter caminithermalis DSM 15212]
MEWGSKTHIGKIRNKNEDSFYVDEKHGRIFIVADGMGGHNAGEVASKMAIEKVSKFIDNNINNVSLQNENEITSLIENAINEGNIEIYKQSSSFENWDGMGTTITMALFVNNKVYLGHVGDSRAYLLKDNELTQLTEDHTLVCELVKNGSITEVEAKSHPKRNVITKALGTEINPIPDILSIEVDDGDIIILCTDGLTNAVDNYMIKDIFLKKSNLQEACDFLINEANNRGGVDNITLIAIRYRHS